MVLKCQHDIEFESTHIQQHFSIRLISLFIESAAVKFEKKNVLYFFRFLDFFITGSFIRSRLINSDSFIDKSNLKQQSIEITFVFLLLLQLLIMYCCWFVRFSTLSCSSPLVESLSTGQSYS